MTKFYIDVVASTLEELEDDIMLETQEFDEKRRKERDCLPLTDYEKLLLREFLKYLID
jgi:hypothetical protein